MNSLNNKKIATADIVEGTIVALISVIVLLFVGLMSWFILDGCNRILGTASELMDIRFQVDDYNRSSRKTDEATAKIEILEERQHEMAYSEDNLVSTYYWSNGLVKFLMVLGCFAGYAMVAAVWLFIAYQPIRLIRRRIRRAHRRKQSE